MGTTFTIRNLFYLQKARRLNMHPGHEYAEILDVVSKFAAHYPGVAFTCRKNENVRASFNKSAGGKLTTAHLSGSPSFSRKCRIMRHLFFPHFSGNF